MFAALAFGLVVLVARWRRSEEALHRRAEEVQGMLDALQASERVYRAIGESIDFGVWLCDADGRNIFASESFLRLVGMTQEECSNFGWGNVLHPDDAERTMAAWKECVRTGGTWDIEHRFRGVDGEWHPILARGVPVRNERGEITCWGGINLDISRLKRAEQELRAAKQRLESLLENSPLAVIEWSSSDFRVVRWSDEATRVFGWTAEETLGKRIDELDCIYPADRARVGQLMTDMLSGARPQNVSRNRNLRKDGSDIHCEWYNSTLHDAPGKLSVLSLVLDVTEREHAEQELADANRAKDEFLAHALARTAHAAQCDPRLVARCSRAHAARRPDCQRAPWRRSNRNARVQVAADRRRARRVAHRQREVPPRRPGRRSRAEIVRAAVDAIRPAADAKQLAARRVDRAGSAVVPATPIGCSRSSGTCCRTPSSSRRPAGASTSTVDPRRRLRRSPQVSDTGAGIPAGLPAARVRTLPAGGQLDDARAARRAWARAGDRPAPGRAARRDRPRRERGQRPRGHLHRDAAGSSRRRARRRAGTRGGADGRRGVAAGIDRADRCPRPRDR